jgi:hypothetical protein
MRIFYDTEFIEDGRTIDLISIGMIREDGTEYYAVSSEFDLKALAASEWLMANVWPSLPQIRGDARMMALSSVRRRAPQHRYVRALFARHDPAVKPRARIAREVAAFITAKPDPALWAWYGAYDHVALAQLFGRMIDLPRGVPMHTNDLKQECDRLGNPRIPEQSSGVHNALADARHNWEIGRFLDERAAAA